MKKLMMVLLLVFTSVNLFGRAAFYNSKGKETLVARRGSNITRYFNDIETIGYYEDHKDYYRLRSYDKPRRIKATLRPSGRGKARVYKGRWKGNTEYHTRSTSTFVSIFKGADTSNEVISLVRRRHGWDIYEGKARVTKIGEIKTTGGSFRVGELLAGLVFSEFLVIE